MEGKRKAMTLWYAVGKTGQGTVFVTQPHRDEHYGRWVGCILGCVSSLVMMAEAEGFELPPIRWSDEPVRLTLTLDY